VGPDAIGRPAGSSGQAERLSRTIRTTRSSLRRGGLALGFPISEGGMIMAKGVHVEGVRPEGQRHDQSEY
jgi:hypothetical protein